MANLLPYIASSIPFVGAPRPFLAAKSLPPVQTMRPRRTIPYSRRISGTGTQILSGYLQSIDNNTDTKGSKWFGEFGQIGISGKMLHDGHVQQSINYVTNPLVAATWRFKPASKSDLDKEVADFCCWAFIENLPWDQILRRILAAYAADGHSLSEMTDNLVRIPASRFGKHPGGGIGLVPTGIHEIPANTIHQWRQKKTDSHQVESIEQWIPYSDTEQGGFRTVPGDRIIRLTFDQGGADFTGKPILRGAYAAWKLKVAFQNIEAVALERTGIGSPVAIASESASDDDIAAAETILENMRAMSKGAMVLDNGWTFSWEGAGENDTTNINIAIERCNNDIACNVSAGFMRLGLAGKSGSFALAGTQQGSYHLSTVGHAKFVSTALTLGFDGWSPVGRIVRANYGEDVAIPVLQARNLPTHPWADVVPVLTNAANVGLVTADDPTEDAIRESLGFDPLDDATARTKPAQVAVSTMRKDPAGNVSPKQDQEGD